MKIPSDHPIAAAALHVVRNTFTPRDLDFRAYFDFQEDDFEYDLHSDGAVVIRPLPGIEGKKRILTLSFKHHFKTIPVLNVNVKGGKIVVAAKSHPISMAVLKSEEGKLIENAKVKDIRKELKAKTV